MQPTFVVVAIAYRLPILYSWFMATRACYWDSKDDTFKCWMNVVEREQKEG